MFLPLFYKKKKVFTSSPPGQGIAYHFKLKHLLYIPQSEEPAYIADLVFVNIELLKYIQQIIVVWTFVISLFLFAFLLGYFIHLSPLSLYLYVYVSVSLSPTFSSTFPCLSFYNFLSFSLSWFLSSFFFVFLSVCLLLSDSLSLFFSDFHLSLSSNPVISCLWSWMTSIFISCRFY